jgi:immune inhibitor A
VAALALAALSLVGSTAALAAAPPFAAGGEATQGVHVLPNALAERQNALRENALKLQLAGKIPAGTKVAKVGESVNGKGQYVQLQQTGSSRIFVLPAEFGDAPFGPWVGSGPLHNKMVAPVRAVNNTDIWYDNPNGGYTKDLYQDLYFNHNPAANSVANYYLGESNGQFTFDGTVSDWVKVPYSEAFYGTDDCNGNGTTTDPSDSTVCAPHVWYLLRDAANAWVEARVAEGWSDQKIHDYLAQYDVEDRYDFDEDGNFNEPDGYIDHFDLLHAGADEAVGGGAEGTNAIWSHRWFAWQGTGTSAGKGPNGNQIGGFEIGKLAGHPTGLWIGDYLMIPENAGVGVIAHETGHDYGLPDEYDRTYGGDASSGFWTIMSSGSYGGDNTNGIGNRPVDFDAWDKWQLGWLTPQVVDPLNDGKSQIKLGPVEASTKQAQAVFAKLPSITKSIKVGVPPSATHAWYSGMGDDYKAALSRTVAVPAAGTTTVAYKTWYEAELDYDYAFLQASTDGGQTWTDLRTYTGTSGAPDDHAFGSGSTDVAEPTWISDSADLSPYAGKSITLRFKYVGDPGVTGRGFEVDDITITNGSTTILSDNVEGADDNGWTPYNFRKVVNGDDTRTFDRAYVIENRQYVGYDTGLKTGPYNFGETDKADKQRWVQHYPYQDGVLVSLWDSSYSDNDLYTHPGHGEILPIDVQQSLITRPRTGGPNGATGIGCAPIGGATVAAGRIQAYDATLSIEPTEALSLLRCSQPFGTGSHPGVTTFDDRNDFTYGLTDPALLAAAGGVITPKAGITVQLKDMDDKGFANISVERA